MRINDDQFNRLFSAAASNRDAAEEKIPSGLQSRIVSAWRASQATGQPVELLRLFRIGLASACALLLLMATVSFREIGRQKDNQFAIPNIVINLALTR